MTLRELFEIYKSVRQPRKNTVRDYTTILYRHAACLLDLSLVDITGERLLAVYNAIKTKSVAQAIKLKTYLNALFQFALDIDAITTKNPARYVKAMTKTDSVTPRETCLDERSLPVFFREIERLGRAERSLLLLLLYSGCRLNEIADLRWSEVDFDNGVLNIPAFRRKVPFDLRVVLSEIPFAILRQLYIRARSPRTDELVFLGVPKRGYAAIRLYTGIDCMPHDLRRTFASVASGVGLEDVVVKKLLGHRLQDQTAKYIKLLDCDAREYNRRIVERMRTLACVELTA